MRNIDKLIPDIYNLLESKEIPEGVDLEAECERFGKQVGEVLLAQLQPEADRRGLRLSQIGRPDRQVYNAYNSVGREAFRGPTYIKFLYGHIIEEMVLALTRIAGHEVTDEQKEVEVAGVTGHMDCRIDGLLVDVKSCSSYGFKKFKNNKLHEDDPFGYIGQIRAYAYAEGDSEYGWLALDKQNGTLALLKYDENKPNAPYADAISWDVEGRVTSLKKLVGGDMPPVCYEEVPDGKSGNMRLATGCAYCDFKSTCWPEARPYYYSTGPRWLTKVVKEPRVALEVPDEF